MPDPTDVPFQLGTLVTGLGGGLALFLFGMQQMTSGLKTVAGDRMKNLLARLTSNRFTAALAGAVVTAVVQSSSVTTVLVVGLISAGLLGVSQSIGVIIGANIGTTVTAQIIAFQVYQYGLLLIAVGFFTEVLSRSETYRQWGRGVMGLGLVFFGMELMNGAAGPLRTWPPFIDSMQQLQNPFLAILLGLLFTALVQSSSATTGIVIVLASQGLMSLETGIGLIFGANIGTCVTAVLSAIGRPREAVQAAIVHVIFNLGGVLLWMFLIPQVADVVRMISPHSVSSDAVERLALETPRQIANAHTMFNVGNALIFIWLTGPMAKLVNRLVPLRPQPEGVGTIYLDRIYLEQPAMALDQVRRELVRMAGHVGGMLKSSIDVVALGTRTDIEALAKVDDDIDTLYSQIISYLGSLSQQDLLDTQVGQVQEFVGIANYLENIGDVVDKNLLENARKRLNSGVRISPTTLAMLRPIHERLVIAFEQAISALETGDRAVALEAIESKSVVNELANRASGHLAIRLVASEPNRLAAFQVETDLIENLKHINTLTRRIARLLLMEDFQPNSVKSESVPAENQLEPTSSDPEP